MSQSTISTMMHNLRKFAEAGDAAACHEPMAGSSRQVAGFQCRATFGDHDILIDEPVGFAGNNLGPNPAEVALAGLAASIQVTLLAYAEFLGAEVRDISIDLSTALDSRGFFGTDPKVNASFSPINVAISFTGNNAPELVAELMRRVEACCPILAVMRNPVEVNLTVSQHG